MKYFFVLFIIDLLIINNYCLGRHTFLIFLLNICYITSFQNYHKIHRELLILIL